MDKTGKLEQLSCPFCGAPVSSQTSGHVCEYCGSRLLEDDAQDLVIATSESRKVTLKDFKAANGQKRDIKILLCVVGLVILLIVIGAEAFLCIILVSVLLLFAFFRGGLFKVRRSLHKLISRQNASEKGEVGSVVDSDQMIEK